MTRTDIFDLPTTLADLWPPNAVSALRVPDDSVDWLPKDPIWRERVTAAGLATGGSLPTIAHEAGVVPAGLELLEQCGLELPREILPFRTAAEMQALVDEQVRLGRKIGIAYTSRHPFAPEDAHVNPPSLVSHLNDKANLEELLPAGAALPRTVVPTDALARTTAEHCRELPLVVKVSTSLGSGTGLDVAICRSYDDVEAATRAFAAAERLVIERYVDFSRTYCMSFAVGRDGAAHLGSAEQICDARGRYFGNWCTGDGPGAEAIAFGMHAGNAAWRAGYRGFLGVDVGLARDDERPWVFDLNFRTNGSTGQVLRYDSIVRRWGVTCTRMLANITFVGTFHEMLEELRALFTCHLAVPLVAFDSARLGAGQPPLCSVLLAGPDARAVNATVARLRERGFRGAVLEKTDTPFTSPRTRT